MTIWRKGEKDRGAGWYMNCRYNSPKGCDRRLPLIEEQAVPNGVNRCATACSLPGFNSRKSCPASGSFWHWIMLGCLRWRIVHLPNWTSSKDLHGPCFFRGTFEVRMPDKRCRTLTHVNAEEQVDIRALCCRQKPWGGLRSMVLLMWRSRKLFLYCWQWLQTHSWEGGTWKTSVTTP